MFKTPQDFHTYRIEAEYIPDFIPQNDDDILSKLTNTTFSKLLNDMFPKDSNSQIRLLEPYGLPIKSNCRAKKAVIFIGKPNTGKSLILKVLSPLLPASVVSLIWIYRYLVGIQRKFSLLGAHINITEDYADSNVSVDRNTFKIDNWQRGCHGFTKISTFYFYRNSYKAGLSRKCFA